MVKVFIAGVRCSSNTLGWILELRQGTGNSYSIEDYTEGGMVTHDWHVLQSEEFLAWR